MEKETCIKGCVLKLYPNDIQKAEIDKTIAACFYLYNCMLNSKVEFYKNNKEYLRESYTNYYQEAPWLREVPSAALCNEARILDTAFQNFFRGLKKDAYYVGFPKPKDETSMKSFGIPCSYSSIGKGSIRLELDCGKNYKLVLPKIGKITCRGSLPTGNFKIIRVVVAQRASGRYTASLTVESDVKAFSKNNPPKIVGIDLGLKNLVVCSNGKTYPNPKFEKEYEKKLKRLDKQLARKNPDSNNYKKAKMKRAKLYEELTFKRKHYLNIISYRLVKKYDVIVIEDLNVKGLVKNHKLAKSISSASWGELVRQLEYKSKRYGRTLIKVGRFFPSSQLCPKCGYKNPEVKDLSVRAWVCPECGQTNDRDLAAANNIRNEGVKILKEKENLD